MLISAVGLAADSASRSSSAAAAAAHRLLHAGRSHASIERRRLERTERINRSNMKKPTLREAADRTRSNSHLHERVDDTREAVCTPEQERQKRQAWGFRD